MSDLNRNPAGPDHRAGAPSFTLGGVLTPPRRRRLYLITAAVLAILVLYGVIGEDEVAPWLEVAGLVLGVSVSGLAGANTARTE